MSYEIAYENAALKEIKAIKKSGNKALLKKLTGLLIEIAEHPRTGTGQVEQQNIILTSKLGRDV